MKKLYLIAFIAIFVWIPSAFAATAIYENEAAFLDQIAPGYYLEDFNGHTYGNPLDASQTTADFGPVNGFSWQASASGGLWSNASALSINIFDDQLLITFNGAPVNVVGGIFAATAQNGQIIVQDVTITLSDGTGTSLTKNEVFFAGFVSDTPIASVTIDGIDVYDSEGMVTTYNWPQVDHFYVGAAKVVPEPSLLLLLASGLIGLAGLRRRWNK